MPAATKSKSTPIEAGLSALPSPRSRRLELLESLLAQTKDPVHARILRAYMTSGTVQGAEQEFEKIIQELVDEA
jgi:hypothetical protein